MTMTKMMMMMMMMMIKMILSMDTYDQVCTPTYFCESCDQQTAPFEVTPSLSNLLQQFFEQARDN